MQARAPLVIGRKAELEELERALAGAREAQGGAVFLVGEPGIGKSRLAAETAGRAFAAGMRVLRGRGSTIGPTVPFRPLAEALLSLFRTGDPPDVAELGPYRPVLGRLIPEWSQNEQESDSGSLVILAEAVLRLTSVLGRRGGCLLILEDLHDSDAETLAVLEYLIDNLDGQPTMLVTTIRDEPCDALDLAWFAVQRGTGSIVPLSRLRREEMRGLVASCLDSDVGTVPQAALDRLWENSAGNPFVAQELLHSMVSTGMLTLGVDGWRLVGEIHTEVPATLVRSIALRADRLGPQGRLLLSAAAVLGHRFPLSVVQKVTGLDDRNLLSHLHAGVAALLVIADEPAPDWYAFQHPLAGEALLAELTPADRADLSRRAADAIESLHPDLPGEWCQLVASLRVHAGDAVGAARLLGEAGRRALADGAATSAVTLLEQAQELLAGHDDAAVAADTLENLLYALAEGGRFDRAFELFEALRDLGGLDNRRTAMLHVRLAWVAVVAGQWPDAARELDAARTLLGEQAADEDLATLNVAAAELALETRGRYGSKERAEELARQAVSAAERARLPAIACQAWLVIGTLAWERDLDEAGQHFDRARLLSERHRLPIRRLYALVRLASNDWLAHGDIANLERARQEAVRVGAISLGFVVDGIIAMHTVLCGRYDEASRLVDECWTPVSRLKLTYVARYLVITRAAIAAHRGQRREMELALGELDTWSREPSQENSVTLRLCRVFCALLEENMPRAKQEMAQIPVSDEENPMTNLLVEPQGLHLLLDVLDGEADWARCDEAISSSVGRIRWNRQFVLLARAVLLGRSGKEDEAMAAVAEAEDVSAIYDMARHLGLRLVAEAALADGWGTPEVWLRRAEEYFHQACVPAVASACRGLLRQTGLSVQQRRTGTDRVPVRLRALGVTVREHEVFELLVDRLGNKAIANRLTISPRTAEKHIASLITKTGVADREALYDYAAKVLQTPPQAANPTD